MAQFRLRRFKVAVASFKEALKLEDNNYQAWGNLGDAYFYGGDTASAIEAYRKAIISANNNSR